MQQTGCPRPEASAAVVLPGPSSKRQAATSPRAETRDRRRRRPFAGRARRRRQQVRWRQADRGGRPRPPRRHHRHRPPGATVAGGAAGPAGDEHPQPGRRHRQRQPAAASAAAGSAAAAAAAPGAPRPARCSRFTSPAKRIARPPDAGGGGEERHRLLLGDLADRRAVDLVPDQDGALALGQRRQRLRRQLPGAGAEASWSSGPGARSSGSGSARRSAADGCGGESVRAPRGWRCPPARAAAGDRAGSPTSAARRRRTRPAPDPRPRPAARPAAGTSGTRSPALPRTPRLAPPGPVELPAARRHDDPPCRWCSPEPAELVPRAAGASDDAAIRRRPGSSAAPSAPRPRRSRRPGSRRAW